MAETPSDPVTRKEMRALSTKVDQSARAAASGAEAAAKAADAAARAADAAAKAAEAAATAAEAAAKSEIVAGGTNAMVTSMHGALMIPQPGQQSNLLDRMATQTIGLEAVVKTGKIIVALAGVFLALGAMVTFFGGGKP